MKHKSCHSGARRNLLNGWIKIPVLAGMTILLLSPAFAQDKPKLAVEPEEKKVEVTPAPDTSVTVSPPGCDFQVTFPAAPYTSKRCPNDAGGRCYDLTRYTMVYEMSTTVDVRFSCNPLMPGQYEQYSEQVTRMALNGMAARSNVQQSTTNFTQENQIRRTSLSGTGTTGRHNKIYIAHIWTSPASMLTMEAELVGPEHAQADAVFGDILKSVSVKKPEAPKTESEEGETPEPEATP